MKLNLAPIKNFASRKFAKTALKLKHYSPEIATGAGIAFGVGCVVIACVQTTKLGKIADEAKEKIDTIHKTNAESPEIYSEKAMKSDLVKVYARSGVDIVRLYALPAGLGALSMAFIIGGHKILRKENAALAAAYMALNESFMQYRKRVIDKQGEDADREYMYGRKKVTMVDMTDPDNPSEPFEVEVQDTNNISPYARMFDVGNDNFGTTPESSMMFLKGVQNYCNDKLHTDGYLFLNEVYYQLGFDGSSVGQFVGWVDGMGDSFVDFGLTSTRPEVRRFINGDEEAILLDFNVDGPIMYIYDRLMADGNTEKFTETLKNRKKKHK